ncbi:MAG TPA: ImmA/IrrE family metallo-endopeptidase [Candidatus Dormibacteraeota bacterium]|jgi:hypothetical protein|nr:ImmA/IrrE family metallo-endopeptidase [Candidatus Dormibacteraeota bacterium]
MFDKDFVMERAQGLFSRVAKESQMSIPVDPLKLARYCGVLSVEHRRMIPEAVLSPVRGGFVLYLQNNFPAEHRNKSRERFSFAHELGHTFFFDQSLPIPKPAKGAPQGERLEKLCNFAAGEILLPSSALNETVRREGSIVSSAKLLELKTRFGVSLEALIRRVHAARLIDDEQFAAVLVEEVDRKQIIRTACYGPLLLSNVSRPHYGDDFEAWVNPLIPSQESLANGQWEHTGKTANVRAKKVFVTPHAFLLEVRLNQLAHTRSVTAATS